MSTEKKEHPHSVPRHELIREIELYLRDLPEKTDRTWAGFHLVRAVLREINNPSVEPLLQEICDRLETYRKDLDGLPSALAVPCEWEFHPEELNDDHLLGFLEGRYDSLNEGNDELVAKEREQARSELIRRGVIKQ